MTLRYVVKVPSSRPDTETMPLVLVMHGRGADANDLADLAPMMDDGYRFVFPNAPKPFEPAPGMSFGFTWFEGWPPAPGTIAESRRLVLELLDHLVERYPTPAGKVVVSGFSQGALMALDVGFRTDAAGIVAMSGALYEDEMPKLTPKPVLLIHGTDDDVIPVNAARRTRRVLEEHGIEPEYHEFPMGHHVTPESMAVVREFLGRLLA